MRTAQCRSVLWGGCLFITVMAFPLRAADLLALPARPTPVVKPAIPAAVDWFDPSDVRLLDGEFRNAMAKDVEYLIRLDPRRLLAWFQKYVGQFEGSDVFLGWERRGLGAAGAQWIAGHYLSACAEMYRSTGDRRLLERVNYIVDELAKCQQTAGNAGLVTAERESKAWTEIAAGNVRRSGHLLNDSFVPWYGIHKVFAGLFDAYDFCGNAKAWQVLLRLTDWCESVIGGLEREKRQLMLAVEHGGMAETLAQIHAHSGDPRHLALARKFRHDDVFLPTAAGTDTLSSRHANTQVPKFVGYQRLYEITGEPEWGAASRHFWTFVARDRSFANGGNSLHEHFNPLDQFVNAMHDTEGPESCNTYNMLKLTLQLFATAPAVVQMDYFERALYNQILPTQHPTRGGFLYFTPLVPGGYRPYSNLDYDFWCCVGTGMENPARFTRGIYGQRGDRLYVNLFIPSALSWAAQRATVRQLTRFPDDGHTRLEFTLAGPRTFTVAVRQPGWADPDGLKLTLNGKVIQAGRTREGYVEVTRLWTDGDVLEAELPMTIRTEMLPNDTGHVAVFYGPILLGARLGREGLVDSDFHTRVMPAKNRLPAARTPAIVVPVARIAEHLKRVPGPTLEFRSHDLCRPADLAFVPVQRIFDERYSLYFRLTSPATWEEDRQRWTAEEQHDRELVALTVDEVRPGEQQPESDHQIASFRSKTGMHPAIGRAWREANDGGWFSYVMTVEPDAPMALRCTYWGGHSDRREFEIHVDEKLIADVRLTGASPGEFIHELYPIPEDLTRGKSVVTVRFKAKPQRVAGGVFDCRTLRLP